VTRRRPPPARKAPEDPQPPKRRIAAVVAQRRQLMQEIAKLHSLGCDSHFVTNAEELLTRWWGTANWTARQELLKSASWMLELESNRNRSEAPV
jgi:hypothetical protein